MPDYSSLQDKEIVIGTDHSIVAAQFANTNRKVRMLRESLVLVYLLVVRGVACCMIFGSRDVDLLLHCKTSFSFCA